MLSAPTPTESRTRFLFLISATHIGMPVPERFSPVNERPDDLLSVDNSNGEVVKTEPLLSRNYPRISS
jgi:hypothetical protein